MDKTRFGPCGPLVFNGRFLKKVFSLLGCVGLGLVGLSFSAQAQEQAFAGLRAQAKPIENLTGFLRMYMGDCQPGPEAATCRQQSAVFRQQANQSSHVFFVFDEAVSFEVRSANGQLNIGWLPFFSAFGYAVAAQPPKQWSKEGQPIYSYTYLRGQLPADISAEEVVRWQRVGRLAAEVIIVPRGTWQVARKGQEPLEGLRVNWRAIRIFDSRSGQTLGVWVN